ncbi:homeobox protein Hox-D8-like [Macrosteles quadrilineatus]|uniref:homeobox protein Hox-D8-like n=1 Tax=Macrosteles quadrilineatus TaxID=74068 RepID=UPI0023E1F2EB|nr:homeobox protein Hox-D8-like [Macrosteles quadrilineatus]
MLIVLTAVTAAEPEFSAYSVISVQSSKAQPYVYSIAGLYPPSMSISPPPPPSPPPSPSPPPCTPVICKPSLCGKTPLLFRPS